MKKQSGYTLLELIIVISFIGGIVLAGGLIYTIIHFLGKVW